MKTHKAQDSDYLSATIIEQLGGKIWIDPDYDKGARFLFTHPICHAQIKKEETR